MAAPNGLRARLGNEAPLSKVDWRSVEARIAAGERQFRTPCGSTVEVRAAAGGRGEEVARRTPPAALSEDVLALRELLAEGVLFMDAEPAGFWDPTFELARDSPQPRVVSRSRSPKGKSTLGQALLARDEL